MPNERQNLLNELVIVMAEESECLVAFVLTLLDRLEQAPCLWEEVPLHNPE